MITKTNNRTRLSVAGLTYDFDFRIDAASDLEVYGITALGVSTEITTGFSVAFDAAAEEGTVTFVAEPTTYAEILMLRAKPYEQSVSIPIRGGFDESVIEKQGLDNLVMQIQQLKELIDFSVKQDPTSVAVTVTLPAPEDGLALVWDGTSGALQNAPVDVGAIADAVAGAEAAQAAAEAAQAAAEAAAGAIDTYASQAEAEAGTVQDKVMNPLRTAQAIAVIATSKARSTITVAYPTETSAVYQAATDLMIIGSLSVFQRDTETLKIIYGPSNPPTEYTSSRTSWKGDGTAGGGTAYQYDVIAYVKKGEYWKGYHTAIGGNPLVLKVLPIGA